MAATIPFLTSGDLIADRRYRWAIDFLTRGDLAGAADVLAQALELAPNFATAWFALGVIRDRQGDRDSAVAAFAQARASDPEDHQGAGLQLARLGAGTATREMTTAFVGRLFDQQAQRFEHALLDHLGYRGPDLLLDAVKRTCGDPLRLGTMLDLGCGTGLAGAAFRPFVDRLVGVDVSAGMIEEARAKAIYDRLVVGEVLQFLLTDATPAGRPLYQLVLAADVFVYLDDLAPVAAAVAPILSSQGRFAFTLETHAGAGVVLQPTLRYAHGRKHVQTSLAAAGFSPRLLEPVCTRLENKAPVPGLLVVAGRN